MRKLRLRIARTGSSARWKRLRKRRQMRWGQFHLQRTERLGQAVTPPCADQRHDVATLRRHPGDRDLRRRSVDLAGDRAQPFDEREVVVEIIALEARTAAAEILPAERSLDQCPLIDPRDSTP